MTEFIDINMNLSPHYKFEYHKKEGMSYMIKSDIFTYLSKNFYLKTKVLMENTSLFFPIDW